MVAVNFIYLGVPATGQGSLCGQWKESCFCEVIQLTSVKCLVKDGDNQGNLLKMHIIYF